MKGIIVSSCFAILCFLQIELLTKKPKKTDVLFSFFFFKGNEMFSHLLH